MWWFSLQMESPLLVRPSRACSSSNTLGLTHDTLETLLRNVQNFEAMSRPDWNPYCLTLPVLRATLFDFLVPMLPGNNGIVV